MNIFKKCDESSFKDNGKCIPFRNDNQKAEYKKPASFLNRAIDKILKPKDDEDDVKLISKNTLSKVTNYQKK